jgi:DNA-binding transcriptional ArsR family regulator
MAEDLLDRIRRELRERLERSRAAYEESRRLEAALAALGTGARPSGPRRRSAASSEPRSPRRRRARPGANRAAILAVVRERPGVSAGEIAQATGLARSTVSTTLSRAAAAAEVERTQLPGGGVGFRPVAETTEQKADSGALAGARDAAATAADE